MKHTIDPPIREPIKQLTGFPDEQTMEESLPENTMSSVSFEPEPPTPRRKRRTKEEMAAFRASQGQGSSSSEMDADPLMADPKYKRAVEKMRSAGLSKTVKAGFSTTAVVTQDDSWKLDNEEEADVDDYSYVLSKKYDILDPTKHWFSMAIYFFAMLGTFIFKRAAKSGIDTWAKRITSWFSDESEQKSAQEIEDEKRNSL